MADWQEQLLNAVFGNLSGKAAGETPAGGEGNYQALVERLADIPEDDVFTWDDGRRYMFTDSGKRVPGGVTPVSRDDFISLILGVGE